MSENTPTPPPLPTESAAAPAPASAVAEESGSGSSAERSLRLLARLALEFLDLGLEFLVGGHWYALNMNGIWVG